MRDKKLCFYEANGKVKKDSIAKLKPGCGKKFPFKKIMFFVWRLLIYVLSGRRALFQKACGLHFIEFGEFAQLNNSGKKKSSRKAITWFGCTR